MSAHTSARAEVCAKVTETLIESSPTPAPPNHYKRRAFVAARIIEMEGRDRLADAHFAGDAAIACAPHEQRQTLELSIG
jgi:hypothetical protein